MVLIIQNDPEVPLGNYREVLESGNVPFKTLHPYAGEELPAAGDFAAVIVLGGAMGANDTERYPFLANVKRFIGEVFEARVPYLGICLGGQLLADVLGGRVVANEAGEKGTLPVELTQAGADDPLFAGVSSEFITFQWHNDTFYLPPGASLLAGSLGCPRQAFRVGSNAYGFQFHPEVTLGIVDCWARWSEETVPIAEQFLAEFTILEKAYLTGSQQILRNFLELAGITVDLPK